MPEKDINGPIYNNQTPPVSTDHVIAAGFYIRDDDGYKNVYCPCGNCLGDFDNMLKCF